MEINKVFVSSLLQTEVEVESENKEDALERVEKSLEDLGLLNEEAVWTQCTTSKLLKEDLEIIKILEESANLETAKKKIIDVINRETGEKYGSESKRCIFS